MTQLMVMAALVAAIYVVWRMLIAPSLKRRDDIDTQLPPELKGARTWARELPLKMDGHVRLIGQLDEALELEDGTLVVTETKSRKVQRVYPSDVLQSAAYASMLARTTRKRVSTEGYIRLITPSGNRYCRVDLPDHSVVAEAARKWEALTTGAEVGQRCDTAALCKKCDYKRECDELETQIRSGAEE